MGSEFAYEDMTSFELAKYRFALLGEERLNDMDMYVLEQTPTDKYSGYSKQRVWLDKAHYRPFKIEFYDKKNSLLKVLTLHDYQLFMDKFWRPMRLEMVNKQTGKSTELITHELRFNTGLTDDDFNKATLKRAR